MQGHSRMIHSAVIYWRPMEKGRRRSRGRRRDGGCEAREAKEAREARKAKKARRGRRDESGHCRIIGEYNNCACAGITSFIILTAHITNTTTKVYAVSGHHSIVGASRSTAVSVRSAERSNSRRPGRCDILLLSRQIYITASSSPLILTQMRNHQRMLSRTKSNLPSKYSWCCAKKTIFVVYRFLDLRFVSENVLK